jgi:hypothetical protein
MPESDLQFSAHEIDDAWRAFERAADALQTATRPNWENRLRALIHVWRTDSVLATVVQPLRTAPLDPDPDMWLRNRSAGDEWALHGGRAPFKLPPDPADAAALMLQLMELFAERGLNVLKVMSVLVGHQGGNYDMRIQRMSEELLAPLAPYVEDRLRRLRRAVQPPPSRGHPPVNVNIGALLGPGATVHGGAYVAGSGNTVDQSSRTLTYGATTELGQAITAWREALSEVEAQRHAEIIAAIEALARAADGEPRRPVELVQAAQTLADATPTLRARITDVVQRWGAKGVAAAAGGAAGALGKEAVSELLANQELVINALRLVLGAGA